MVSRPVKACLDMSSQISTSSSPHLSPELASASGLARQQRWPASGPPSPGALVSSDVRATPPAIAGAEPEAVAGLPRLGALADTEPRLALDVHRLGLDAILFDLDGVVTRTASLHARVWGRLFDEFLARRAPRCGEMPFRWPEDYHAHVDGKPRAEGVRSFLLSRGIELPPGAPSDDPESDTVCGLGNRKAQLVLELLETQGVEVFDSTVAVIRAVRAAALKTACVSSSLNCRKVLDSARLTDQFDVIYDGTDLAEDGLPGKPRPDCFLRAAALIGVEPGNAAIVEDAVVGVAAGRAGGFRLVIGVDRGAGRQALLDAGADIVVSDLSELMTTGNR